MAAEWSTAFSFRDGESGFRQRRGRREAQSFDIMPMIDITFLLLIFFTVAMTPDAMTAVDLPPARNGMAVSARQAVVITLADRGNGQAEVYLADGRLPAARLPADGDFNEAIGRYVERGQAEGKNAVLIKAEGNLLEGEVQKTVAAVSQVPQVRLFFAVLEAER